MVETSRISREALFLHCGLIRLLFNFYRATPYSFVYGMKVVLLVEIEMGSLRVALEQQISKTDWAHARLDQLNLLYERRLRVADHVHAYRWKMVRAFKKRTEPILRVNNQFSESSNSHRMGGRHFY
ncbi:hypothetical protein AAG906_015657 [Vitis piasezkii]